MNTEAILVILDRVKRDYMLTYSVKGDMVHFTIEGIEDEFKASVLGEECVLSTHEWHEHLSSPAEMESFLRSLLSGRIEIIITYRGNKPVAHRVQRVVDGHVQVFSRTGDLFFPFWRLKTQKKLDYTIGHKKS
ncbi:hypothetical protein JXQ70_02960 [bacterium]|nr:hypothetical protein [bacterium]